jgi:hypothetical protein
MEMRLGDHLDDDLFLYERSRFRSATVGVVIMSVLTMGLGIVVWRVVTDLLHSQITTLQIAATTLGVALIITVIVWLYLIVRLIVRFYTYRIVLLEKHRGVLLSGITLAVALLLAALVPVVVIFFNPII